MVRSLLSSHIPDLSNSNRPKGSPIQNVGYQLHAAHDASRSIAVLAGFVTAAAFGAVHVAGWNLVFPAAVEQLAWRCACLFMVRSVVVFFIFVGIGSLCVSCSDVRLALGPLLGFLVVCAGEAVYPCRDFQDTIFFLPPDAYVSTWTCNLPHFY